MAFNELIKDYFSFSQQEKRGIIILLIVLVLVVLAPVIYRLFIKGPIQPYDISSYREQILFFEAGLQKNSDRSVELFTFDPNTVDSVELLQLGFTPKQAYTFLNYRKKGGKFFKKEDVKKVYSVTDAHYNQLEPYIQILRLQRNNKSTVEERTSVKQIKESEKFQFDPNTIDSLNLLKLGFSPKQAHTFLNYRRKGGKFYRKEDVGKIYSVSDMMYVALEPYIVIAQRNVQSVDGERFDDNNRGEKLTAKLDLNKAIPKDFMRLGIESKIAWRIVNYRKLLGGYHSIDQLKKVYDITNDQLTILYENVTIELDTLSK